MAIGDISLKWGSNTEITWASGGPASLADATLTSASNTLDVQGLSFVIDVLIIAKLRTAAGSLGTGPLVYLYAAGSLDNTNFTLNDIDSLTSIGSHEIQTADTEEWTRVYSLAQAFGGTLPPYVKFAIENQTGLSLSSTADAVELYYIPVYANQVPA